MYVPTSQFPKTPPVSLEFSGLFLLCFDSSNSCQVGGINADRDHKLAVLVRDLKTGETTGVNYGTAKSIRILALKDQDKVVNAYVNPDSANDPRNFTYMPDFEGSKFHKAQLTPDTDKLRPIIIINAGVFYTKQLSFNVFERWSQDQNSKVGLGHIPLTTATNIPLSAGDLQISVDDTVVKTLSRTGKYRIYFYNDCVDCEFNPKGSTAKERNDFHLYYKAIDPGKLSPPQKPYDLVCPNPVLQIALPAGFDPTVKSKIFYSDPAPCGGGGALLGTTTKFP